MGFIKIPRRYATLYIDTDKIEYVYEDFRGTDIHMDSGAEFNLHGYNVSCYGDKIDFEKREEEIPF